MAYAVECDSKRIEQVALYKPKFTSSGSSKKKKRVRNIKAFHIFFLCLYVYQIYWCLSTVGEPYRKFLLKADEQGFQVMEGTTKMRAELEYALSDINNPERPKDKIGWFDWMNMDIEEHAERKKRDKEQTVLDSLPKHMRVPKQHMPEFIPMLLLGLVATLHALMVLMQHWSVAFNVWLNYTEINVTNVEIPEELMDLNDDMEDEDGGSAGAESNGKVKSLGDLVYEKAGSAPIPSHLPTHARISPASEKDVLVPLLYLPTLGLTFEYHRRRYTYDPNNDIWTKIRCRTTMPTTFFSTWEGFEETHQITASEIRFGKNIFNVRQPTFKDLYKAQLLSPFTVFQLFCVVLWMLDDYWQYSFFTLFMILMFEATVVFSRIKSLSALKGMGNKPRPVMVYRMEQWELVESCDLLPGDIVSLTRQKVHADGKTDFEDGDVVPADLLLLRGSAVVNEASLTGESVPQMKEGISELLEGENLSMKNQHKNHVLYAGTKMLQCKGVDVVDAEEEEDVKDGMIEASEKVFDSIPKPPDGGSLCFVLRTGFLSAQGKLVRMIEGSQEKVKGHEKETGLLLLLLFFFAVASSSYVLYHGLRNEKRSQYELLLHCILIITSVIPPELPMQMALAVNNSLMTLMKMQVFCTEPYRVPMAGKLDACLFDKTGTLTTDELVAVGVCDAKALSSAKKDDKSILTPMTKVSNEAALVLAGCHSLVMIEGETTGDPLENAALSAMRWGIAEKTGHAAPLPATGKKDAGKTITLSGSATPVSELEILGRHHFSSKLQRMSCVARDVKKKTVYAVAKGSPEAIGNLLATKPKQYDETSKILAKRGYRVISLAYKQLKGTEQIENAKDTRQACETEIIFAGFIAFTCRVRRDTKMVLNRLQEGGMSVAMVTGDALLTAAHVAKEVGICSSDKENDDDDDDAVPIMERNEELKKLIERRRKEMKSKKVVIKKKVKSPRKPILILEKNKAGLMFWQSYDDDSNVKDFIASEVPEVAKQYDLATTGKNLQAAFEYDEGTTKVLASFKIFARMTPDAKETVIECLHSVGLLCLMCGDGANDVGALKGADVGVALLTGFGDLNVDKGEDGANKSAIKKKNDSSEITVERVVKPEQLQALRMMPASILRTKIRQLGVDASKKYPELVEKEDLMKLFEVKVVEKFIKDREKKEFAAKQKSGRSDDMADKQRRIQLRVQELEAQGVQWAQVKAMKEFMNEEKDVVKKKRGELAKKNGVEGQAANLAAQFDDLDMGELPTVKLGDASIAAPFTSKMPSIRSCVDIIRQGRCTLVTSMQMYQILALNCMISSYSLSVLYLDGVKYGDVQMTAMGMLMTVSFTTVSRSKPLDKLSSVKPLTSIFHPSIFISLLSQFAVHFAIMMLAVRSAKAHLPPDYEPDLDGEFHPGILNSVVFLVSNVQQVTVFVVNLQGRPFMTGLTENRPLLWSLLATFILTFMFASESVPSLNKYFQLVAFPSDEFRDSILKLLAADVFLTFIVDRAMKLIFAPHILMASMKGTTMKDVFSLAKTVAIIMVIMHMFLGNNETWDEMLQQIEEEEALLNGSAELLIDSTEEVISTMGFDEL